MDGHGRRNKKEGDGMGRKGQLEKRGDITGEDGRKNKLENKGEKTGEGKNIKR